MASECIVAGELGLAYAAVCVGRQPRQRHRRRAARRRGARGRPRRPTRARLRRRPRGAAAGARHVSRRPMPASTVTGAALDGEPVGLRCEDGRIVALGAGRRARARRRDDRRRRRAASSPPLVNGHTHAAMTLFRGYGGDLPLMRWLQEEVWPVEARLEAEDVYWGTRLACLEMIRTGTARFWDMYWHPEATSRAVRDAGPAGDDRRAAVRRRTATRRRSRRRRSATSRSSQDTRAADRAGARPPLDLHRQRGAAALDGGARRRARARRSTSTSPRPSRRSSDCLAAHGVRPAALPRPARAARRAHRARPRRLARPRRSWS